MKKVSIITLVIFMMILFTACGESSSVPEGMNQVTYETGKTALEIIQKYNSADIDADEAESRIDTFYDKLDDLDLSGDEELNNISVLNQLDAFRMSVSGFEGYDTYTVESELKDILNE